MEIIANETTAAHVGNWIYSLRHILREDEMQATL